jgi:hypothetical protein
MNGDMLPGSSGVMAPMGDQFFRRLDEIERDWDGEVTEKRMERLLAS